MMKIKHPLSSIILVLFLTFISISCNKDDETPRGQYATGVIVVNEGNFGDADGSFDFYEPSQEIMTSDIYGTANSLQTSGVFQSIFFHEQLGYMIDQVGNRVTVVEAETFEYQATIVDGLSTPRYMVAANGKGYISNWGPFDANFNLTNSFVAVIDLANNSLLKTIEVGDGAEGLTVFGDQVFVANSYSNTIQEINTATDEVVSTIEIADAPLSFVEDNAGKHWVLSSSFLTGAAKLTQIDLASETILKSIEVSGSSKSLNINGAGTVLYFLSAPFGAEGQVFAVPTSASTAPTDPLLTQANLYGLGVNPENDEIYVANNNAFQGNGTIQRYTNTGELLDTFAAGRVPNGFAYRK
jgi:YVTN family beta-propeller protein